MQLAWGYDDHLPIPQIAGFAEKHLFQRLAHSAQPVVDIRQSWHCRSERQAPQHETGECDLASGLLCRTGREQAHPAFAARENVQPPVDVDQLKQPVVAKFIQEGRNDETSGAEVQQRHVGRRPGYAVPGPVRHVPAVVVPGGADRFAHPDPCHGRAWR